MAITPDDVITGAATARGSAGRASARSTAWVKPRSIKPLQGLHVSAGRVRPLPHALRHRHLPGAPAALQAAVALHVAGQPSEQENARIEYWWSSMYGCLLMS